MSRVFSGIAVFLTIALVAPQASLALPDADTLLADLGVSADDIAAIKSGRIVTLSPKASTERELVAGFAFKVATPAGDLQKEMKSGLLASIDPNTIGRGPISGNGHSTTSHSSP